MKVNKFEFIIIKYLLYILVNRNRFQFQYIIGKGGFGKVWKVLDKKHQKP